MVVDFASASSRLRSPPELEGEIPSYEAALNLTTVAKLTPTKGIQISLLIVQTKLYSITM